ncbi:MULTISPECIES: hypothetical protein [unclassified Mycolicibacterium]|nr:MULTISPECIES: hypothetical protein [unclassified Mycolicibacterium]
MTSRQSEPRIDGCGAGAELLAALTDALVALLEAARGERDPDLGPA